MRRLNEVSHIMVQYLLDGQVSIWIVIFWLPMNIFIFQACVCLISQLCKPLADIPSRSNLVLYSRDANGDEFCP